MAEDKSYGVIRSTAKRAEPDAHGQAALLLAESTLHMLVDKAALTNAEAVCVVTAATSVKREVATAAEESVDRMEESLQLLMRMKASFETDGTLERPATEPHFPRFT